MGPKKREKSLKTPSSPAKKIARSITYKYKVGYPKSPSKSKNAEKAIKMDRKEHIPVSTAAKLGGE